MTDMKWMRRLLAFALVALLPWMAAAQGSGMRAQVKSESRSRQRRFASLNILKRFMAIHGYCSKAARRIVMICMMGKMPVRLK